MKQQSAHLGEWNEFAINTDQIVKFETKFLSDPDMMPYRKYSSEMGFELERIIRTLLIENCKPTVDYSEESRQYLMERQAKFKESLFRPFDTDYFIVSSEMSRDQKPLSFRLGEGEYMYLFSYDQPLTVTRDEIGSQDFELLFALALRQCDLMKIFPFMDYHLENNFQADLNTFLPYLTQLNRKFSLTLFTDELTESIGEWIADNKSRAIQRNQKKVKTNLTVDKLACLFRLFVDCSLLSDENKADIIRMIPNNFQSKMREDISRKSVEAKFFNPTDEALSFWEEEFNKMALKAHQLAEKNRK